MPNRDLEHLERGNNATTASLGVIATAIVAVIGAAVKAAANNKAIGQLEARKDTLTDQPFGKIRHHKEIVILNSKINKRRGNK